MRTLLTLAAIATALTALGCRSRDQPQPLRSRASVAASSSSPVTVNQPPRLTSIETGERDALGRPLRVPCATCHSLRRDADLPARAEDLARFHVGLKLRHGDLPCASCHQRGHSDALHLADGAPLEMAEVLRLCGQCHGPQLRSYEHGAHGGMSGHWDLTRGPRTRNSCVDCHDPHAPAFPSARPVLPPRDRFLPPPDEAPHG